MILAMHPMLKLLLPELILIVGAAFILLAGLSRSMVRNAMGLALLFVLGALVAAWRLAGNDGGTFDVPQLHNGPLVWYVRLVTLAVGALILLVNRHVPDDAERGEFFSLILVSLCGITLVSIANNLILLFLALELVSVPTYILIGLSRRDIRAQEATAKYFFLGAFAAAIMLYGFSFLYGAAGTMQMFAGRGAQTSIHAVLSMPGALSDHFVIIGLVLSLGGLAFKIAAVPLHFYVADVYQGAASPVAGLLGFVPKFAGFIAIIHILSLCDWCHIPQKAAVSNDALFWLLWVLAAATMFVGNTLALMQNNIKRMLAYSSIAHSGYMLVALVAGPAMQIVGAESSPLRNGVTAVLFYMAVYGVMNLGAFAAVSFFRKPGENDAEDSVEMLDDLAGAGRRHPWASLALAICVLGLMGFPLTGGFVGKFYVFIAALSASSAPESLVADGGSTARYTGMIVLVVIGVLNAAIGAAYYLRILATCYLRKPAEGVSPNTCGALRMAMALCAAFVLVIFFRPSVLFNQSSAAAAVPERAVFQAGPAPTPGAAENEPSKTIAWDASP